MKFIHEDHSTSRMEHKEEKKNIQQIRKISSLYLVSINKCFGSFQQNTFSINVHYNFYCGFS